MLGLKGLRAHLDPEEFRAEALEGTPGPRGLLGLKRLRAHLDPVIKHQLAQPVEADIWAAARALQRALPAGHHARRPRIPLLLRAATGPAQLATTRERRRHALG